MFRFGPRPTNLKNSKSQPTLFGCPLSKVLPNSRLAFALLPGRNTLEHGVSMTDTAESLRTRYLEAQEQLESTVLCSCTSQNDDDNKSAVSLGEFSARSLSVGKRLMCINKMASEDCGGLFPLADCEKLVKYLSEKHVDLFELMVQTASICFQRLDNGEQAAQLDASDNSYCWLPWASIEAAVTARLEELQPQLQSPAKPPAASRIASPVVAHVTKSDEDRTESVTERAKKKMRVR
eukprot:GILJ01007161.1.p1 GENE.GILJ01007161.1~~GILJ01007161.1.p1  ORF type:complete len:236 (-),score=32.90 GILJ01007161.1:151-858(-)